MQYEPTYKYEPMLQSLWTDKDEAIEAAKKISFGDNVWVETMAVNKDYYLDDIDSSEYFQVRSAYKDKT